jgi:hypothetical protein
MSTTIEHSPNPVLRSLAPAITDPWHVKIDMDRLQALARKYADGELALPKWQDPVFLPGRGNDVINALIIGNSINFGYIDPETGNKFAKSYAGINWAGAFGMWAALREAFEAHNPLLAPKNLAHITEEQVQGLFNGNPPMPMLKERAEILRTMGYRLFGMGYGQFSGMLRGEIGIEMTPVFGFDGLLDNLVRSFPTVFHDSQWYRGSEIVFNKKAQLAVAMLYERFLAEGVRLFPADEMAELTVFADYELPRALRLNGVLVYSESLAKMVDNKIPVPRNSEAEIELRAGTVWAAHLLREGVNSIRGHDGSVTALEMDYRLWRDAKADKTTNSHITSTPRY